MTTIWILTKTNLFGEILALEVYASEYDAQMALNADYEIELKDATDNGRDVASGYSFNTAWINLDSDEGYDWEIFERDLTPELGF